MTKRVDTLSRTIFIGSLELQYRPEHFVNPDVYDFHHQVWAGRDPQAFIFTSYGYVFAIVFPEYFSFDDSDAINLLADAGRLDRFQLKPNELVDFEVGTDSEGNPEYEGISFLGNASEPFATDGLDMFTLSARQFETDPAISIWLSEL